jgi:hypothetical protein
MVHSLFKMELSWICNRCCNQLIWAHFSQTNFDLKSFEIIQNPWRSGGVSIGKSVPNLIFYIHEFFQNFSQSPHSALARQLPRHARPLADCRLAPRAAVLTKPPRPDCLARAARLPTAAVRSRALAAPARRPSPSRRAGEPSSPLSPVRRRRVVAGSLSSAAAPCAAVRLGQERFRPSAPD